MAVIVLISLRVGSSSETLMFWAYASGNRRSIRSHASGTVPLVEEDSPFLTRRI